MARPLEPDAVLALQFIRDARLSPDGKFVAYALWRTVESGDVSEIRLVDLDSGRERSMSTGGFASHPRWSRDGARLLYVSNGQGANTLSVVDAGTGEQRSIDLGAALVQGPPAWSPDGKTVAVVLETRESHAPEVRQTPSRLFRAEGIGFVGGRSQRLASINLADGSVHTLTEELGFYSGLEWDDAGECLLFLATASPVPAASFSPALYSIDVITRVTRRYLDEDWFITAARWIPGGERVAVVGAYRSPVTVPTTDLWVVDCATGDVSCRSSQVKGRVGLRLHHDMPVWDAGWNDALVVKDASSAWATVQCGGRAEIWKLSLSGAEHCERVLGGGERSVILADACAARKTLLFATTDLLTPLDLHVFDGHAEKQITAVNRDVLEHWPSLSHRHLTFRGPDGLELEGWFIADAARTGPLPTIMFVHGGPFMATGHAFRFDFHLLASRGFGILLANFRGSFGYGEEFGMAIVGDWGARGFGDHMAAVDRAIELGLADARRLGVWGASHGGFATCWIVGHTTRFRAAIAEAAVTNLTSAYYLSDAPDYFSRDLGGKPHEIPDAYRARSPLTYAHRCRTPTLLIHGEKDLRCPIAEAEQFHRALLDVGCESGLVRLRDANHMGDSMGPPGARVGQNAALVDWFERFV